MVIKHELFSLKRWVSCILKLKHIQVIMSIFVIVISVLLLVISGSWRVTTLVEFSTYALKFWKIARIQALSINDVY